MGIRRVLLIACRIDLKLGGNVSPDLKLDGNVSPDLGDKMHFDS